ncbi:Protein of unknown function [Terribacillus aidingensis]|uniref:DUF3813 domain-containing protein n=1 Tax=Terribacillus aidingensis TaxID=586416 RepID=A0A285NXU9_9BACI|nr:DUF3813 family protein [Terribacillus aidingensis]SNZ14314.1 Protein of unknown function [Terribacillus aidingensis]
MENFFEKAKHKMQSLTNKPSKDDSATAQEAIQSAYNDATAEEKQKLQDFQQKLDQ